MTDQQWMIKELIEKRTESIKTAYRPQHLQTWWTLDFVVIDWNDLLADLKHLSNEEKWVEILKPMDFRVKEKRDDLAHRQKEEKFYK